MIANLRAAGHQAWLVGGCVRDLLLGRAAERLRRRHSTPGPTGFWICFRAPAAWARISAWCWCATAVDQVEVATFRSDHDYRWTAAIPMACTSKRDPQQDVLRRDFTINGLLMDPDTRRGARLRRTAAADLDAGLIRAIGDPRRRFREDHLRLLRGVRFAARLGFTDRAGDLRGHPALTHR